MDVSSNWISENDANLSQAIKVTQTLSSENIFEILSEEQGVILRPPLDACDVDCTIKILFSTSSDCGTNLPNQSTSTGTVNSDFQEGILVSNEHKAEPKTIDIHKSYNLHCSNYFNKVIVLSEARLLEIYQLPHMEYIKTVHSTLLKDLDDTKIYQTDLIFDKPCNAVVLKLKGLFSQESLWIYGIFIQNIENPHDELQLPKPAKNSFDTLDDILKERNIVLSEKAECFKKFLTACNSVEGLQFGSRFPLNMPGVNTPISNLPSVLFNIEKMCSISKLITDNASNPENYVETQASKELQKKEAHLESRSILGGNSTNSNARDGSPNYIDKTFVEKLVSDLIEEKLQNFEERIILKVGEKIEKANKGVTEKLNKIEQLLLKLTNSEL